jgi:hypothetical protein
MTPPRILGANSPRQNPNARVVGWHYDYLLRAGAISNGQTIETELPLTPLGTPFCLRAIGGYNVAAGPVVSQLSGVFLEFDNGGVNQWLQTQEIGLSGNWPSGGFNALYEPVWQQVVYPNNSAITVRIRNSSGGDLADVRIVFRGTRLFYRDRITVFPYPDCFNYLPFERGITIPLSANTTTANIPLQAFNGDLVIRGATLEQDVSVAGSIPDLEVALKDQYGQGYSNDFIHYRWLFSQQSAQRPGIFYPEIYIPKDRQLLIDAQQNSATSPQVQLNFIGQRVYPR